MEEGASGVIVIDEGVDGVDGVIAVRFRYEIFPRSLCRVILGSTSLPHLVCHGPYSLCRGATAQLEPPSST